MKNNIKYILWGVGIILLGISFSINVSTVVITDESIVLVFVGILATFVVVGNYAQVTEIRSNTERQIKELDSKTQNRINKLDILYQNIEKETKRLNNIEKQSNLALAEAYRALGIMGYNNEQIKHGTGNLIKSLEMFNKSDTLIKSTDHICEMIHDRLNPAIWNNDEVSGEFNYSKYIALLKDLPDSLNKKQLIIEELEAYYKNDTSAKKYN